VWSSSGANIFSVLCVFISLLFKEPVSREKMVEEAFVQRSGKRLPRRKQVRLAKRRDPDSAGFKSFLLFKIHRLARRSVVSKEAFITRVSTGPALET
jgi:hypothetical protein